MIIDSGAAQWRWAGKRAAWLMPRCPSQRAMRMLLNASVRRSSQDECRASGVEHEGFPSTQRVLTNSVGRESDAQMADPAGNTERVVDVYRLPKQDLSSAGCDRPTTR